MSLRVLIVEDTDHVREMLRHLMELHGFEVAGEASSAAEGVALALEAAPDVVVMDYKLGEVHGVEAARRIRDARPGQPVILYSAWPDQRLQELAREAGVEAVVPKSEGVEALAREIGAVALRLGLGPGED